MFVRLTFINVTSGNEEEAQRIFMQQVIPVVKEQKGNKDIRLLQSAQNKSEFISVTEWESESDANLYESSGTYKSLVDTLKDSYSSKPVLKTYHVVESKVAASL